MFRLLLIIFFLCILITPALAQEQTLLSLQTSATSLQTGQEYEVTIRLDNAPAVWVASVEITFDPSIIYVMGTRSGSPIRQGSLFAPPESTVVVRNRVEDNKLVYTISMLAPANPAQGSGVVGTFRVYPLAAGTTSLIISQAELTSLTFTGEGESRTGSNPQPVPFSPVLLNLNISGDTVQPPSEATATPEPTVTSDQSGGVVPPTGAPTLVNVTAAPQVLATVPAPVEVQSSGPSIPFVIGIVAMIIGAIGLIILFSRSRRR